jgi:hypothetical protein
MILSFANPAARISTGLSYLPANPGEIPFAQLQRHGAFIAAFPFVDMKVSTLFTAPLGIDSESLPILVRCKRKIAACAVCSFGNDTLIGNSQ